MLTTYTSSGSYCSWNIIIRPADALVDRGPNSKTTLFHCAIYFHAVCPHDVRPLRPNSCGTNDCVRFRSFRRVSWERLGVLGEIKRVSNVRKTRPHFTHAASSICFPFPNKPKWLFVRRRVSTDRPSSNNID